MIGILRKFDKTWPEIPTLTSSGIKPSLLRTSVLFNLPTEIPIILLKYGYTEKKSNEIYHNHLVKNFVGIEKIIAEYI